MQTNPHSSPNPRSTLKLTYRPELDGLRGIALLLVMGFHAQIAGLEAGFLGVDLFFVLSGYLITRLIYAQLLTDTFDLSQFYIRRSWRLFPTLWVVILVSSSFAYFLLSPSLFKDFGQSIVASLLFVSNFLFWHESGYFQAESLDKALIHTWSLGVEEQFYFVFPLLLLALTRHNTQVSRKLAWSLGLLFVLSLGFSEWAWRTRPSLNYYLPLSRFWTFICGAFVALYELKVFRYIPTVFVNVTRYSASLGSIGILLSILFYEQWMPSPSILTIIPILSMVLLLSACHTTSLIYRLLCFRPLRYLGLISYSAYLWHQPCLAFSRQFFITDHLTLLQSSCAISLSLILAHLTYTFVETPYRRNDLNLNKNKSVIILIGSSLIFIIMGTWIHLSQGMINRRSTEQMMQLNKINSYGQISVNPCPYKGMYHCYLGKQNTQATYALVGDSHAGMYTGAFQQALNQKGLSMSYTGDGWCVPLINFYTDDFRKNNRACHKHMTPALRRIAQSPHIHTVFLAAEWTHYINGQRHGSSLSRYYYEGTRNSLKPHAKTSTDHSIRQANLEAFAHAFADTLELFRQYQKRVIIIGPVPEYSFSIPKRMAQLSFRNLDFDSLHQNFSQYQYDHHLFFELMAQHAISNTSTQQGKEQGMLQAISLWPVNEQFCTQQQCQPYQAPALPYYCDSNHLSALGAAKVVNAIVDSEQIFP